MKFFKIIGTFFKALFTSRNVKAMTATAERAALTVTDAAHGDIADAVTEATATASAAKSLKVVK